MKNIANRKSLILSVLFSSTLASAAPTCLPIQGTVQTQAQTPLLTSAGGVNIGAEQVGIITLTAVPGDGNLIAFQKAFGQLMLIGGVHGYVNGVSQTGISVTHEIGFPGVGSIISINDTAYFTNGGIPDREGNIPTNESGPLTTATVEAGAFTGWTGNMTATGVVNIETGTNSFTYSGQLCN